MPLSARDDLDELVSLAPTADWNGDAPAPTFSVRLDEAAAAMHPLGFVRLVLVLFGGLTGVLVVGWPTSLVWVVGGWAIEGWSWTATRAYARGERIDPPARINFVANYLAMNLWWILLSILFWRTGTAPGQASAAVMFIALTAITFLLFHNVPAGFLAAGSAPAVGALSVLLLADGRGWVQLAPIWMSLILATIFCLGRALETPSMQQSNRRLNRSLNKFRILAENVPDIIAQFDLQGRFTYASPASLSVLGYAPGALVGRLMGDLLQPGELQNIATVVERLLASPAEPYVFTALTRHKDGRWLSIQTSINLVQEGGVPAGFIGVSRDITERVATDAALQAAKSEAEAANRIKSEFLANISHEFRTPMNGVLGALQLLESEPVSSEGEKLLQNAKACGKTLSQLLNDVLDFSRLADGRLELTPEPVEVGEILRSITGALHGEAVSKGLDLRCEIAGDELWIKADPVHLRQAMFNLVGNAVKFTAAGHVAARLSVEPVAGARRQVRLEVEDTGIGVSPEVQTILFEQFRQVDGSATRGFGGVGLGLSLTRAIVQVMDGQIGFSSTKGEGSTFWMSFEAPAAEPEVAAPVDRDMLAGVNILLVEDNPTNRLVTRAMLTRLGATLDDAEDGLDGVEAARLGAYDLILMDIQMPRMGGVEATRAIRALPGAASQVPILAVTANVMPQQQAEYMAAGMNGVVAKPISLAALLSQIARLAEPDDARRSA